MNVEIVQRSFRSARPFESIRSGSFILFTVKKAKGKGLYAVLLNGKEVDVKSSTALTPGKRYRAVLIKHSTGIELKLDTKGSPVENALEKMSLSTLGTDRDIAESIIKSSLALNYSNYKVIKDALKYLKKKDKNRIRLLAMMLEKEIPLNSMTVGELFRLCYGYEKNRENREEFPDTDNKRDLEESIKNYILRNDGSMDLLKYFNHKRDGMITGLLFPFDTAMVLSSAVC